jgi:predicted enzyme related to lactoylglutathione lyase
MTETASRAGHFVWHDLTATDPQKGQDFYVKLLGWNTSEMGEPGQSLTIFSVGEDPVADVMQLDPSQGPQSYWTSYVSIDDADETAKTAVAHGGKVIVPPFDTPFGRILILQDPGGAYIHTIAVPEMPKEGPWPPVAGTFCWFELMVPDPDAVTPFYEALFGWTRTVGTEMGAMGTYWMFQRGEGQAGGMMKMPPMVPVPNWLPYIAVDDVDASTAKATQLGATVLTPAQDVPGTGRFSVIQDPVGAAVALFTAEPMPA